LPYIAKTCFLLDELHHERLILKMFLKKFFIFRDINKQLGKILQMKFFSNFSKIDATITKKNHRGYIKARQKQDFSF